MRKNELFDLSDLRRDLSDQQKSDLLANVCYMAQLGFKFFYTTAEVCSILHLSKDSIVNKLHNYTLDAIAIRGTYRIAWWAVAEFLLDTQDDIEVCFYEYIQKRYK